MDQGIEHHQNMQGHSLGVVPIMAPNDEYETLLPPVPNIEWTLQEGEAGNPCQYRSTVYIGGCGYEELHYPHKKCPDS